MEHSLMMEATKATMTAYLNNRPPQIYYWSDFFPSKTTPFLTYETLVGTKGNPVMADVVAENTKAPIKRRKIINKLTGDIPPIKISRQMLESDLNKYNQIKAMFSGKGGDFSQILDLVFDDVGFCYDGCNATLEFLALRALSQTYIALSSSTNAGGIITTSNIDYGMDSTNKNCAAVVWTATSSTTTPITDFRTAVTEGRTTYGAKYKYALMDLTDWEYFRKSSETQNYVYTTLQGGTTVKRPTLAETNSMLSEQGLPTIILIDQTLNTENKDGSQSSVTPWVTGHVVFLPELNTGDMFFGPIADETNPPKQAIQVKKNGILIQKYSDVNPVTEWTNGIVNAFPSWPTVDSCINLYTLHASTWA